jgi:hypothetical protein
VVETRCFLKFSLYALGDLVERVLQCGAGPVCLDDHGFDGDSGIFVSPEAEVGAGARHHQHDHQVRNERAVPDGPI